MFSELFKNRKAARKHLCSVLFYLEAVEKNYKPCYLWDAFSAELTEVQNYLKELNSKGHIKSKLESFCINGTIFVTHYQNFRHYVSMLCPENIEIIDVSKTNDRPYVLKTESKNQILKSIIECMETILTSLKLVEEKTNIEIVCNSTTLFGALLGYPVLYWYKSKYPSDTTCLSMVPLTVYRVLLSDAEWDLYSFSIPSETLVECASLIGRWFKVLTSDGSQMRILNHQIVLPCVSM